MKISISIVLLLTCFCIQAQNIGLHTDSPSENIHMIGDLRVDDYTNGNEILRLYKDRLAFRTGNFTSSYLSIDSIGSGSFAAGKNLLALGENTVAFGIENRVLGFNSFSAGTENILYGEVCFATGNDNTLFGDYNAAFGSNNHGTGLFNLVAGFNNAVSGSASSAYGAANTSRSDINFTTVSYTHLRAHETSLHLVCRLLLEKKK